MKTIWKYKVTWQAIRAAVENRSGAVQVDMPIGSRIVHFAIQANEPCIWAIVESGREKVQRYFMVVGTGHAVPGDEFDFVATTLDGPSVWHLFERVLVPITV